MISKKLLQLAICAILICFSAGCGNEGKSGPAPRSADDVLGGIRLKQLTKALELTDDQQGKVKALFDEENKEVAKIHEDPNLSMTQQSIKITELRKETYGKMKPLLTPAQLEKFEEMSSNAAKRKKKN